MAAIFLSILWDREIPVEMLDLYTDSINEPQESPELVLSSKPSLNYETFPPIVQNGIITVSSESAGILTRHIIEKQQAVLGEDRTLLILYALELNAFGVGYDCSSQKLHVTGEFEEFCSSRQLRIQSPVCAESLLQLIKYRKIFECFADVGEEISLLTCFRRSCAQRGDVSLYNDCISVGGKRIFDQFRQELEPYCSIAEESDQPVIPGLEETLCPKYRISFNAYQETYQSYLEICRLLKAAEMEFDSYFFAVYFKYCQRKSTSNAMKRRFMRAMSRPVSLFMVMLNPACLEHDFNDKHIHEIDDFYKMHPLCVRILLGMNFSLVSMAKAVREIKSFAKKNGNQIIGLIETHNRIDYNLKEISRETLEQLLEAYRVNAGSPLLEKSADLDAFEYRDYINELTTTTDLECEGWKMKNCVGGYAPLLESDRGHTRIFHIDGARPSTAAIYFNGAPGDLTYEIYGIGNCDPAPEHVLITEHLGRYLSNTIWNDVEQRQEGDNPTYV
jgi:hypothetical protein